MEEIVKMKGGRKTLLLDFADDAPYAAIRANIEEKLTLGADFFPRGTVVLFPKESLEQEEQDDLKALFRKHGLICRQMTEKEEAQSGRGKKAAKDVEKAKADKEGTPPAQEMVVINKTIRGGQEVRTDSSVLVVGNVNPGAQIIAGGSIDVRGTCRGMVHAGAAGDTSAIIVADRLMPTQIRIANLIARSPDSVEKSERAERASIKDGRIVIEPIER